MVFISFLDATYIVTIFIIIIIIIIIIVITVIVIIVITIIIIVVVIVKNLSKTSASISIINITFERYHFVASLLFCRWNHPSLVFDRSRM